MDYIVMTNHRNNTVCLVLNNDGCFDWSNNNATPMDEAQAMCWVNTLRELFSYRYDDFLPNMIWVAENREPDYNDDPF